MTAQPLWEEAVGRLRARLSPQNYDMWLRPIELMSFDGSILRLRAPNSYVRLWFESNYLESLRRELAELGHEIRVEFDPESEERPSAVGTGPIEAPVMVPIPQNPKIAPRDFNPNSSAARGTWTVLIPLEQKPQIAATV